MIRRFFNTEASIMRKTTESDGMGGSTTSWNETSTSRGTLDLLSGNENYLASKFMEESTHIWICEANTDIRSADRLLINGVNYEVIYPDDPMGMGRHMEVAVKRLESGQV